MSAAAAPSRRATDRPERSRLVTLLTGKEIVVCCGSGGVGKTSVAAALALAAAEHRDGKVLVLTVDPARRLATVLGIGGIGNLERQVDPELLRAAGIDVCAEVWAAMLDTKQSWDALVLRHAPDEQTAYRILHNRLYDNLTARFVQSHDYIAIERLFELHNEGKYDLIIVDTPPSRNAVDFLDVPSRMREFFGGRLLRWLTLPYRVGGGRGARVISVASRPFYQIADRLIGSRFLEEIADFFLNFQSMYDGFVKRADAVEQLLRDRRTTFAVITTLEAAPLHEAEEFFTELASRRLQLGALVCNRVLPDYFVAPEALAAARELDLRADALGDDIAASDGGSVGELAAASDVRRVLHTVASSFRDFSAVGVQEHQLRADLARVPDVTVTVPMRTADVSDVDGLAWIVRRMLGRTEAEDGADDGTGDATEAARGRAGMTFDDIARTRTTLNRRALADVRRLASTWRPLADLSFSDLLLLGSLEGDEGHRFVVLAQLRPTTGQTLYPTDMVGTIVDEIERPMLTRVWRLGEIVESDTSALGSKERVRVQVIPIRDGDELVGLLTREYVPNLGRRPGELERTYLEVFQRLARMVADGVFPFLHDEEEFEGAPRVGDGVLVLDADTRVRFASPNAVSAMHRMGIHAYAQGMRLAEIGFDDTPIVAAFDEVQPILEEVERNDVVVAVRGIPLVDAAEVTGAIVLMRDVTDVRRRDRMLMSKDATIREIHHRVKNNLQTIASLLRLQRRRLTSAEARAALAESERRIRSIAIVHETLSRDAGDVVDFTEIVKPLVREVEESVSSADLSIRFTVEGEGGNLPGEVATPLAVVLNELMQNAVDHAFIDRSAGTVHVVLTRRAEQLEIDVADDGVGLPDDFTLDASTGLGLSIVKALVTGELGGSIEMRANRTGTGGSGTSVHVRVPVSAPRVEV